MKFKRLYIKNIASIAEAEIDFTSPLLRNESLFLICGETGAGKTTLLDAICLALYKTTPRLEQSNNEKYRDEWLQVNEKGDNVGIQVKDPRQYLKRGEKRGMVSLEFEGNDRKSYEAVLTLEFSKTFNLKAPGWVLTEEGGALYDKDREIKAKIEEVVGFDFDQFCRTSMLAQGEFTRFLKSSEKEKSDILEKLTGTGIYSEIGSAVFERYRSEKQRYETLLSHLSQIRLLTPEQEEEMRRRMQELMTGTEQLAVRLRQYEGWMKWMQDAVRLSEEKTAAAARVEELEEKWKEMAEDRQLLSEWRGSEPERNLCLQLESLEKERPMLEAERKKLADEFQILTADECYHKALVRQKEQEVEKMAAWLADRKAFEPMYAEQAVLSLQLGQYANALNETRIQSESKEKLGKIIEKQQQELAGKRKELELQREGMRQKEMVIRQLQQQMKALDRPALQQAITHWEQVSESVTNAVGKWDLYEQALQDVATLDKEAVAMQSAMEQLEKETTELLSRCAESDEQALQARTLYEKMQLSVGDYAKHLRAHMSVGDSCPVCGNTVGELPRDETYEAALKPVREALLSAEQKNKAWHFRLNGCQAQQKASSDAYARLRERRQEKARYMESKKEQAVQVSLRCQLDPEEGSVRQRLSGMGSTAASKLRELREKWQRAEQIQQQLNALNEEKEKIAEFLSETERTLSQLEKALAASTSEISHLDATLQTQQALTRQLSETLSEKISYPDWQRELAGTATRLQKEAAEYLRVTQQKNDAAQYCVLKKQEQEQAREWCRHILALYPDWPVCQQARPKPDDRLGWAALSTAVSAFHQKESHRKEALVSATAALETYASGPEAIPLQRLRFLAGKDNAEIAEINRRVVACESQLNQAKGAQSQAEHTWRQHGLNRPEMPENCQMETIRSMITSVSAAMADGQREVGAIRQQLDNQEKQLQTYAEKQREIEQCREQVAQWEELCNVFGDREGKKFRVLVQRFVMKELLVNANSYLRQFSDRYELLCEENLTILVKDAYYGGNRRPLNMVSGGESFVVSLALALGLSSLNQNAASADILFIDEGFGSLSSDLLEVVMTTLDRLRGSRRVGVISHVEALRERIPVKILVEKTTLASSKITIVSQ